MPDFRKFLSLGVMGCSRIRPDAYMVSWLAVMWEGALLMKEEAGRRLFQHKNILHRLHCHCCILCLKECPCSDKEEGAEHQTNTLDQAL